MCFPCTHHGQLLLIARPRPHDVSPMESLKFFVKLIHNSWLSDPGPFFKADAFPKLNGQKWLVTGATGGIGLEIAKVLAKLGAELWLVGRNPEKLAAAQQELKSSTGNASISTLVIDYTDLATVKPAVETLKQQTTSLNGIIHNAGVMNVPTGSKTEQGIELTVGVNNVATQLLQDLMDPLIVNVRNARILWLSSLGHTLAPRGGFDLSVLESRSPPAIYGMSKAWDYIQAVQWTLNHPESPVKSIAVHPGVIKSDLTRTSTWYERKIINLISYDTHLGALPPLYAALYPSAKNNDYIVPFGRPGPVRPDIYRAARGDEGIAVVRWIHEQLKNYE